MKRLLLAAALLLVGAHAHAQTSKAEVRADVLAIQIPKAVDAKRLTDAAKLLEEYAKLGVPMPPPLILQRAVVYFKLKRFTDAEAQLTNYLEKSERGSDEYNRAVLMLAEVEPKAKAEVEAKRAAAAAKQAAVAAKQAAAKAKVEAAAAARQAAAKAAAEAEAESRRVAAQKLGLSGLLCPSTPTENVDEHCWMQITSLPGCYGLVPSDIAEIVSWSKKCISGKVNGKGRLVKKYQEEGNERVVKSKGMLQDGKAQGEWVEKWKFGDKGKAVDKGSYVDGKKQGEWVTKSTDSDGYQSEERGQYVDGKRQGEWVTKETRSDDYQIEERGQYVDDKRQGEWVTKSTFYDEAYYVECATYRDHAYTGEC